MKTILDEIKCMNIFNPVDWFHLFYRHRLIHFLFVGSTGVLINLLFTGFLTEFFFGRENYFYAYMIGLFANLTYNFIMYSFFTFNTNNNHSKRYFIFICYSLGMAFLQASVVKKLVSIVGVDFYLFVIAGVILFFSLFNYFIFKLWLFKNK